MIDADRSRQGPRKQSSVKLPLLQPTISRIISRWRLCRHLWLMCLRVFLCKTSADLFVGLEVRLLAVLVAIRYAMAFETLLERLQNPVALRACSLL